MRLNDNDTGYQITLKSSPEELNQGYLDGFADGYSRGWQECWEYFRTIVKEDKPEAEAESTKNE